MTFILYLLFLSSGFVALVYEVIWARKLSLVFGTDAYAIATILAVFFTGLAVGSWVFGKVVDKQFSFLNRKSLIINPLLLYGFLELGIGTYAALTPWLFDGIGRLQTLFWQQFSPAFGGFSAFTFVLSFAGLLIPAVLMGGTLPVIVKALSQGQVGSLVGGLYAVNTAGAVAGTAIAGFLLVVTFGVNQTIWVAAGISVIVGGIAVYLSTREYQGKVRNQQEGRILRSPVHSSLSSVLILFAFFLAGFSAIALEVLWTRILVMVIGGSTYAFTVVLVAFLLGIALGSALITPFVDRLRYTLILFALVELLLGAFVILSIPLFGELPFWFLAIYKSFGTSFAGLQSGIWLLASAVMVLPTLLMGVAFPLVVKTYRAENPGEQVGTVYAVNTAGGVIGAVVAGFLVIPEIGVQRGILMAGMLYVLIGVGIFFLTHIPQWSKVLITIVILVFIVIGFQFAPWNASILTAGFYIDPSASGKIPPGELLYYADGISTNVAVRKDKDGTLSLRINGKADASTGGDMENQLLLGHLPMMLHPSAPRPAQGSGQAPQDALVIGMGSGITLGSVLSHPVARVDAIEIEEKVIEAARLFNEYSNNALDDPRVSLFVADGRHFLLATTKQYDVITSEPSNPWLSGSSKLFTKEYFELLRGGIKEDGVVLQWINLYAIDVEGLKRVIAAFQEVFPHVVAFGMPASNDIALVGSIQKIQFDYEQLAASLEDKKIAADLAKVGIREPFEILAYFVFDRDAIRKLVGDTPPNTDNHPYVEFAAPRYLYQPLRENPWRLIFDNLSPIQSITTQFSETEELMAIFTYARAEELRRARIAAQIYSIEKNVGEGIKAAEKALEIDRDNTFLRELLTQFYFEEGVSFFNQANYSKAVTSLKKSLEYKKTPESYFNLAQSYEWDGNLEEAENAYEQATILDPGFEIGFVKLGEISEGLGDLNKALENFKRAAEINPRNKEALLKVGQLYILRSDYGRAREALDKALKIDPNFRQARELLEKIP